MVAEETEEVTDRVEAVVGTVPVTMALYPLPGEKAQSPPCAPQQWPVAGRCNGAPLPIFRQDLWDGASPPAPLRLLSLLQGRIPPLQGVTSPPPLGGSPLPSAAVPTEAGSGLAWPALPAPVPTTTR